MSDYKKQQKYRVSIIGDSISTYEGYNPAGYAVYYDEERIYLYQMQGAGDTWWMQVIEALDGELCVNNSYSGSYVMGRHPSSACSIERCSALHDNEKPNLILVYMGTNDRGFCSDLGYDEPDNTLKFYGAYRTMVSNVKQNYPQAQVVCATLMNAKVEGEELPSDAYLKIAENYNDAIRRAATEEGALVADLAAFGELYDTVDYCHPTKEGHKLMSSLWLKCLRKLL